MALVVVSGLLFASLVCNGFLYLAGRNYRQAAIGYRDMIKEITLTFRGTHRV